MGFFDFLRRMFGGGAAAGDQPDRNYHYEFGRDEEFGRFRESDLDTIRSYDYYDFEFAEHDDFSDNHQNQTNRPVHIHYDGLLKNCGADAVYLHYAFNNWDPSTIRTVQMGRHEDGSFGFDITDEGTREVNYCFKDSASNWDNNNGWNWSQTV